MEASQKLELIKLLHTLVWAVVVAIIFYVLYCGISGDITSYTWIGIGLVLCEGLVLAIFRFVCPLTILARRYSDSTEDNFDIYLPNWLAKWNKIIFISIFSVALILVILRVVVGT